MMLHCWRSRPFQQQQQRGELRPWEQRGALAAACWKGNRGLRARCGGEGCPAWLLFGLPLLSPSAWCQPPWGDADPVGHVFGVTSGWVLCTGAAARKAANRSVVGFLRLPWQMPQLGPTGREDGAETILHFQPVPSYAPHPPPASHPCTPPVIHLHMRMLRGLGNPFPVMKAFWRRDGAGPRASSPPGCRIWAVPGLCWGLS